MAKLVNFILCEETPTIQLWTVDGSLIGELNRTTNESWLLRKNEKVGGDEPIRKLRLVPTEPAIEGEPT